MTDNTPMGDLSDNTGSTSREPSDDSGLVVGVDIGGTKVALMATDVASGDELPQDRFAIPISSGPDEFFTILVAAIRDLIATTGRAEDALRAVGVAVPGQVEFDHGRVISAGNLTGWRDVPLRDLLCRELDTPAFVEQDANVAALGERWRGGAKQMNNFVFLALGTGAGAGIVVNGRLHRGFRNAAGEVGSLIMSRSSMGKERHDHGNLELLIGGRSIRRTASRLVGEVLGTGEVLSRGETDARLAPLTAKVADHIAMSVIAIATVLDPDAVIFGGGTAAAGDWFIDQIRERVRRELNPAPALLPSVLGEDAQLDGAVFGALWELDPELALREELR